MEKQEFVLKPIGETNYRKEIEITYEYQKLFAAAEQLKSKLEFCLKRDKYYSFTVFTDFLRSEPKKWIYSKHIEYNNIDYPGMDVDKLIELNIVPIPGIEDVLQSRTRLDNHIKNIQSFHFSYPLKKLWDDKEQKFDPDMNFWEQLDKHCTRFTKSEEQNMVLAKFEKLCEALNGLVDLDILRPKNGIGQLIQLQNWIEIPNRANKSGFSVKSILFWTPGIGKWKISEITKSEFDNNDILLTL